MPRQINRNKNFSRRTGTLSNLQFCVCSSSYHISRIWSDNSISDACISLLYSSAARAISSRKLGAVVLVMAVFLASMSAAHRAAPTKEGC